MSTANPLHPPFPTGIGKRFTWGNLPGASLGLALSALLSESQQLVVIVTPDSATAERLQHEISFFHSGEVMAFPDWETLPYDHFSPHQDIISKRLEALYKIPSLTKGVVITPIATLMHRLCPREYLEGNTFLLQQGEQLNLDATRKRLEKAGYRNVAEVKEHGEFSVRGSILDVYPMGSKLPFRIDLFDDEIDSIRTFSPETQLSLDKIHKIEMIPAKEFPLTEDAIELFRKNWRSQFAGNPLNCPLYQDISEGIFTPGIEYYLPFFFEKAATFFDYLPEKCLLISISSIHAKAEEFWREIRLRYDQYSHNVERPILPPEHLFIPVPEIFNQLKNLPQIRVEDKEAEYVFAVRKIPPLEINHKAAQPLHALQNFLQTFPGRILFCAETAGRREVLLQLLHTIEIHPKTLLDWQTFLNGQEKLAITVSALDEGFQLENPQVALISEAQLFGKQFIERRYRKETVQDPDAIIKNLTELAIGAPVVHLDHGIGRYLGLQTLTIGDVTAEFLSLEYAGNDKLYVPISSLHLISRYSGTDPEHVSMNQLGSSQWQKSKRKAQEEVRDVAAELLDLYAKREAQNGFACKPPDEDYLLFSENFAFEETPDQARTIDQVMTDMQSEKPMDRLVCGDVGFGKTEVAMRAAFFAVQNGKQVAVLVPTTLLAEQHFQTFSDRFADWPFQVDVLSRFKTKKEQEKMIEQIAQGKIDIIIGTHKLLQENIQFKSLGLIVIDEEHRFGVRQKERLKALRFSADILTLTATPIPRTLNMAFSGMRDLSIIATPPAKRLSIKTFVHEYQDSIVQEAITREILRGGQVFYLHNEVATIEKSARLIEKLIPEARVGIAHGQMHERALESTMSDFYHRRFNVLVCTTIIESGIDIPSANTIVIDRADKLGLAQLHQLRGRVGRSHHQAYCYLFIPSRKILTVDAEKRLDALAALEDLGIGFTLATHDLEIRGAGELLGEGQSGNIQAIGFTLYMDLLSRAVDALKSGKEIELEQTFGKGTEIDLHLTALIPSSYLGDPQLRLQFYKRIASTKNPRELDDIQVEMIDRFGLLPDAAKNLFAITALKQDAEGLGIKKIDAGNKGGTIEFQDKPNVDPMRIVHLIQTDPKRFKLEGPTRLQFTLGEHEPKKRIEIMDEILQFLRKP